MLWNRIPTFYFENRKFPHAAVSSYLFCETLTFPVVWECHKVGNKGALENVGAAGLTAVHIHHSRRLFVNRYKSTY